MIPAFQFMMQLIYPANYKNNFATWYFVLNDCNCLSTFVKYLPAVESPSKLVAAVFQPLFFPVSFESLLSFEPPPPGIPVKPHT